MESWPGFAVNSYPQTIALWDQQSLAREPPAWVSALYLLGVCHAVSLYEQAQQIELTSLVDLFPGMNVCVPRVAPPANQWQVTAVVVTVNQNISHMERHGGKKWNKSSVLKYIVGQSLSLWPSSIPTKECLYPAMSGMCSYALARLKSAWEPWGLRTLNIGARCFARLPQLLQNKVALNKRPALKHKV